MNNDRRTRHVISEVYIAAQRSSPSQYQPVWSTMTQGTQEDLLPRALTFAAVALFIFVLVFIVIGISVNGDDTQTEEPGDEEEGRKKRCRTARGCIAYFRRSSTHLPLWKSITIKIGVVVFTTIGSSCVSLVINNATSNQEETIKQTIAEILMFDNDQYDPVDTPRKKRELCTEDNDTACWESRVKNMIDRPKDLCDQVNEWGETVDPVFCTLFVSMTIFLLVFMMGLLTPVVAFFLLSPAIKSIKVEEITAAIIETMRNKWNRLGMGHRDVVERTDSGATPVLPDHPTDAIGGARPRTSMAQPPAQTMQEPDITLAPRSWADIGDSVTREMDWTTLSSIIGAVMTQQPRVSETMMVPMMRNVETRDMENELELEMNRTSSTMVVPEVPGGAAAETDETKLNDQFK